MNAETSKTPLYDISQISAQAERSVRMVSINVSSLMMATTSKMDTSMNRVLVIRSLRHAASTCQSLADGLELGAICPEQKSEPQAVPTPVEGAH